MTSRLLLLPLLIVAAAVPLAGAATNDRPKAGKFTGEHAFGGPVTLRFKREDGIGLYVHRYKVRGTLKCPGEDVPFEFGGLNTARTFSRVKKNRRFRLSTAGMRLRGEFTGAKRIKGDLEVITSPCTQEGGFTAKRTG